MYSDTLSMFIDDYVCNQTINKKGGIKMELRSLYRNVICIETRLFLAFNGKFPLFKS